MTIVLSEDWSGYAEGTQVQNIDGWSVAGEFASLRSAPQVNSASQIKVVSQSNGMAYYSTGVLSHYIEVELARVFTGTFILAGATVGIVPDVQYITTQIQSANKIAILKRNTLDGGEVQLVSYNLASDLVVGDLLKLVLDDDSTTVEAFVNGASIGAAVAITGTYESTTNVGFRCQVSDPFMGAIELGTLVDVNIALDNDVSRKVYSVNSDKEYDYPVSGTYTGTAPPSIRSRVRNSSNGLTVIDWSDLDEAPSGGTFSGVITMPLGPYYVIDVDFSDDSAQTVTSGEVGFGLVVEFAGQSNTDNLMTGTLEETPSSNISFFDGATYTLPSAGAYVSALNKISAENNNCVIAAYTTAEPATSIQQHLPGGDKYSARVAALTAAGGKLNMMWWGQGESNIGAPSTYYGYLGDLYTDILTRTGQASATLPLFIVQLGRNAGETGDDSGWQGIRNAQTEYANDTASVYISHQTIDLPMTDELHRTSAGLYMEALRFGDSFNDVYTNTGDSGRGVVPTSATYSGTTVTISHDLNGSTQVAAPTNAENYYEISGDDFATTSTATAIEVVGTSQLAVTFSSIPATPKIRSVQGQDFVVAELPTGDKAYDGQSVMVEPITIEMALIELSSTINLSATGLPDGTYSCQFWDDDADPMTRIAVGDVVFTSGAGSYVLVAATGTTVYTRTDTATPNTTGVTNLGVTV